MSEPLDLEPIKARLADYDDARMWSADKALTDYERDVPALVAEVERLRAVNREQHNGLAVAMSYLQTIQRGPGDEVGLRASAARGWDRVNAVFMECDPRFAKP